MVESFKLNPVFDILITICGFVNFFLTLASWASIQKKIYTEIGGTGLDFFLLIQWVLLVIMLCFNSIISAASVTYGKIRYLYIYCAIAFYECFSSFFSYIYMSMCNDLRDTFKNDAAHNTLQKKAKHYISQETDMQSNRSTVEAKIDEYINESCMKYPEWLSIASTVIAVVVPVACGLYWAYEYYIHRKESTSANDSIKS